ncbi:Uncharacterised protein [Mobiluncus mulieris]|uniref:hypothetical protein n=1 Tax=Mobiluncus mulieris TaxID=2052 RepID=UPI00019F9144|nr:hypothetical protein [Mobiluncus mulieris]EEJ54810.1 hypothetical protein HMPREF0577_0333 [Mobiluncus mulieris ATCC 35243]SPX76656.1 Uncharacterised protein [Mobiluncus mulieris]
MPVGRDGAGTADSPDQVWGDDITVESHSGGVTASGGLFSPDSRLYQALSWVVSLFAANLLAAVGFAVVLPGGLSWLLLFSLGACLVRDGDFTWRGLWEIIRANWLVASGLWLADLLFTSLVLWESFVLARLGVPGLRIAWGALLCLAVFLVIIVNQWMWAMLAMRGGNPLAPHEPRAESNGASPQRTPRRNPQHNPQRNQRHSQQLGRRELRTYLRAALLLSLCHLPRSLVGVLMTVAPIIIVWLQPDSLWQVLAWETFFGTAFGVYLVVLAQYRPLVTFFRAAGSFNTDAPGGDSAGL